MLNLTPGQLAMYDQYLAGTNVALDGMVRALKQGFDQVGEVAAMTAVQEFLAEKYESEELAGMLSLALRRLSVDRG